MAEEVKGNRVREDFGFWSIPGEDGCGLCLKLTHRGGTGTGCCLVGADNHAADGGKLQERSEDHHKQDGRAVRVGDDAIVIGEGIRVDFRDDKWDGWVHPEGG